MLTEQDINSIEKILKDIIITFVNALVFKSAEPWTRSLNLVSLLEKYKNDKQKITEISIDDCNCSSDEDCVKAHDNLYETVFCELSTYAYEKPDKVTEYNLQKHNDIMEIIDKIFNKPLFITEWNIYIEIMLKEIKSITKRNGGRRTKKIYKQYIKYD